MGVYIKGMEMPTKGYRLILVHADGTVQTTDGETTAISVPPHGRVIDVDKVLDELAHNLGIRSLDYLTPSERAIVSWFRDAPTIILAEPPKEES